VIAFAARSGVARSSTEAVLIGQLEAIELGRFVEDRVVHAGRVSQGVVHPGPAAFARQGTNYGPGGKHHRVIRTGKFVAQALQTSGDDCAVVFAAQADESTTTEQATALS